MWVVKLPSVLWPLSLITFHNTNCPVSLASPGHFSERIHDSLKMFVGLYSQCTVVQLYSSVEVTEDWTGDCGSYYSNPRNL